MARPAAAYPQVEATASALIEKRMVACPPGCRVGAALSRARRAGAGVLLIGHRRVARRRDLSRAARWRLGRLPAAALAWPALPTVTAGAPEVKARRLVVEGSPLVVVSDARHVLGVIDGERVAIARPLLSLADRLDRAAEPSRRLLRVAGDVGDGLGARVFAVGGFVRDLLLDRAPADVDLVVEGDGIEFARRLAEKVGGTLSAHPEFGTASLDRAVDGVRVDIASARRERYGAPGALPLVSPASVDEDLRRRDFTVNAMAIAVSPSAFGRLLDPLGGRRDLRARRLRPLGPLSFVEDPTRIFRAARYAARLGFRLDALGRQALALALKVGAFPALSGQRLRTEVELIAAEPDRGVGFELLIRWNALRVWDRGYRTRAARGFAHLRAARRLMAWSERQGLPELPRGDLALIALLVDQEGAVAERCLERLAVRGRARTTLYAGATSHVLARGLARQSLRHRSDVADVLDPCPDLTIAGAWLAGGERARRWIEWFWTSGRAARPLLTGRDLIALGVRPGPLIGECLAVLRRHRLDGRLTTRDDERAFMHAWLDARSVPRARAGRGDAGRGVRASAGDRARPIGSVDGRGGDGGSSLQAKERCV